MRALRPRRRGQVAGLGLKVTTDHCDLTIVGGGPAGLAAAVSAASEGLETRIISEVMGGQAFTSPLMENYLGFPAGISGEELTRVACEQASRFGARMLVPHLAVALESEGGTHAVTIDNGDILTSRAVLLAMGARYRKLDVPGADRLTGHGIHYGSALSAAEGLSGQPVAVVGGANSAAQSVLHLARHASEVHLLVRGDGTEDKMSAYLVDRIDATPNVTIHTHTEVMAVSGDQRVERVLISNGEVVPLDVAGLFVFIGASPPTSWLRGTVDLDERGFVQAFQGLQTSVPGVFAAGDVRAGSVKRIASAAGEGVMAVQYVHTYLDSVALAA